MVTPHASIRPLPAGLLGLAALTFGACPAPYAGSETDADVVDSGASDIDGDAALPCGSDQCAAEGSCFEIGQAHPASACTLCTSDAVWGPCPVGCGEAGACRTVESIDAGDVHTCALLSDGSVWCWGSTRNHVVGGPPPATTPLPPTRVADLSDVHAMASGATHVCALHGQGQSTGTVRLSCWGGNAFGQIDGALVPKYQAAPHFIDDEIVGNPLGLGPWRTCVKDHCWGLELGEDPDDPAPDALDLEPTFVDFPPVVIEQLAVGIVGACALVARSEAGQLLHEVLCWGDDSEGALAVGAFGRVSSPTVVPGLSRPSALVAGDGHWCALVADGAGVWCWGASDRGQTGVRSLDPVAFPIEVGAWLGEPARQLCAGALHTCAVTESGRVACWGDNESGQLGAESVPWSSRARFVELPKAAAVACGRRHTCAVDVAGAVRCWGDNADGQLGLGTMGLGSYEPKLVAWPEGQP